MRASSFHALLSVPRDNSNMKMPERGYLVSNKDNDMISSTIICCVSSSCNYMVCSMINPKLRTS